MVNQKKEGYRRCRAAITALCEGETELIARMASVVAVLHGEMPGFFWTGFYRVVGDGLVIGPYQGTVGCLRIEFGKGVCGTAAESGVPQIVPDVHQFPGHIACDPNSRSEIVVPVKDQTGQLIAVLDVDSDQPGWFDEIDRENLEVILEETFAGESIP
jgi:GAF domain-containing protein